MPQMADITVKKNDGTTDVVYTQQQPSGGDKAPARWRHENAALVPALRPSLESTFMAGNNNARRGKVNYTYPVTITVNGVAITRKINLVVDGFIPQDVAQTDIDEAVSQGLNLAAAALTKTSFKSGYAPS